MYYLCSVGKLNQVLAILLLAVLSVNFFPVESHQHHAEELIICHDAENHFDEHSVSCELCDFLLQEYLNQSGEFTYNLQDNLFDSFVIPIAIGYNSFICIPDYRGPPSRT